MPRIDFALSPAQRADAREALKLLDGSGLTLEDAARRALHGRRALRRVKLADAVDQFILSRVKRGKRARTVEWYEAKLRVVVAALGDRYLDDIDHPMLVDWLNTLREATPGGLAGLGRACRALWRWAMHHQPPLATVDATLGLAMSGPRSKGEAEVLTVDEVAAIMAGAGKYQSAGALMIFFGVRPEEVAGRDKPPLLWKHVNVEERLLRIPADIAKTGKPRIIEGLPEGFWSWLRPGKPEEPVSPGRTRQFLRLAQRAIGRPWPPDATRHTFATYMLAYTNDPGKVSLWLGHEGKPTLLYLDYRALTTRPVAEKFVALRPPATRPDAGCAR